MFDMVLMRFRVAKIVFDITIQMTLEQFLAQTFKPANKLTSELTEKSLRA